MFCYDCATRFIHISGGILVHSSSQILSKSLRLRFQYEGMRFIHSPLDAVESSCTLGRETAPKHNVSTSMLDGADGVLGVIFSIQTRQVELMPKSLILVSSDHILSPNPPYNHSSVHWQTSGGPVHVLP